MKPIIDAFYRRDLTFEAPDLGGMRTGETFRQERLSLANSLALDATITDCLQLLDAKYWPAQVKIELETEAQMTFPDGFKETIPVSLIVSQQQPSISSIRMGMFEINDDAKAFKSILAHEMGHMLPEWACRKTGVTGADEPFLTHWSKPVYEGVADWIAAVISGTTLIGSHNIWFQRDILAWESLAESKGTVGALARFMKESLQRTGLTKYRAYREWIDIVNRYMGDKPDPYAEGQWIAKQLWTLSTGRRNAKWICDAIIHVAASGQSFDDSEIFLAEVEAHK